jgi:hypothetical protein
MQMPYFLLKVCIAMDLGDCVRHMKGAQCRQHANEAQCGESRNQPRSMKGGWEMQHSRPRQGVAGNCERPQVANFALSTLSVQLDCNLRSPCLGRSVIGGRKLE